MNELRKEIWENGIHYTLIGNYYFPDVRSPEDCGSFGRWADLHLAPPCKEEQGESFTPSGLVLVLLKWYT